MIKINHARLAIISGLAFTLSSVTSYSQHLWLVQHAAAPVLSHQQLTTKTLATAEQSEEFLTVISRRTHGDESTITRTTRSYDANGALAGSTADRQIKRVDGLTGHTLIQYHGANNQDKTQSSYDSLGRTSLVQQTEQDLQGQWHTTGQQTQYHLAAGDTYVTVSHFGDSEAKNVDTSNLLSSKTTHLDAMGREIYTTDSRHGSKHTHQRRYDDLGHVTVKTDLLGNTETMTYDPQGQVINTTKSVSHKSNNGDNALPIIQTIKQLSIIDYVENTVTSHQCATLSNTKGEKCTAQRIQHFDDQQHLTQESTGATNTFVTSSRYDNLGNKIQDSQAVKSVVAANGVSDTLVSTFTSDALNNTATATVLQRAGNSNDRYAIKVEFANDLGGKLISKTINGKQPYRYRYDAAGNIVEEIRYDIKATEDSSIHQRYLRSANGYIVKRTAWSPSNTTGKTAETDYYGDVDGKKMLLRAAFPDYTIDYTMDYNIGKLSKRRQISRAINPQTVNDPNATITYQYDDPSGHLLSQDNGDGQVINYRYYSPISTVMPDALETRTIEGVSMTYKQDGMQTITQISTPNQPTLAKTITVSDALGEVYQVIRTDNQGQQIDNTVKTYDAYQRITHLAFQAKDKAAIGYIDYSYTDTKNQLRRQLASQTEHSNGSDRTITTSYEDDNGNRLAHVLKTDSNSTAIPNSLQAASTKATQNSHDAFGNLTEKTDPTNDYQYTYDGYNQLTSVKHNGTVSPTIKWDANGNLRQDETGAIRTFDAENHEVEYQNSDKTIAVHDQWADQLRLTQRVGATVFRYQYANGQLIDTRVQTQTGQAPVAQNGWCSIYVTPTLRVIKDNHQVIALQYLSVGKEGSVMYAKTVNMQNIEHATQMDEYHYDTEGNLADNKAKKSISLDIMAVTRLFHGGLRDLVSGEDYKMARFLTTHTGGMRQFTSRDFGQKLVNLDGFANENSVLYGDASGHHLSYQSILNNIVAPAVSFLASGGVAELYRRFGFFCGGPTTALMAGCLGGFFMGAAIGAGLSILSQRLNAPNQKIKFRATAIIWPMLSGGVGASSSFSIMYSIDRYYARKELMELEGMIDNGTHIGLIPATELAEHIGPLANGLPKDLLSQISETAGPTKLNGVPTWISEVEDTMAAKKPLTLQQAARVKEFMTTSHFAPSKFAYLYGYFPNLYSAESIAIKLFGT